MCWHWLIVSGPLPKWVNDETYRRLIAMNHWLAHHCREQEYMFVDNCPSIWGCPDLESSYLVLLFCLAIQTDIWCRFNTRDVALCRSQVTREPASNSVSCGMASSSLANMAISLIILPNIPNIGQNDETDCLIYNTEIVTFARHFLTVSSSKCVSHNDLIWISNSDGGKCLSKHLTQSWIIKYQSLWLLHPWL